MIEKFKTNAEVIENGDKYLYGNHVRMPISMERGEGVYVFDNTLAAVLLTGGKASHRRRSAGIRVSASVCKGSSVTSSAA